MSKSKFTPGTWKFIDGDSPGIDSVPQGEREFSIVIFGQIGIDHEEVGVQGRSREEAVANARLMVDAPKMLKLIRAFYETEDTDGDEWTRAINEASEILERHGG